jgi:hypothetical protein
VTLTSFAFLSLNGLTLAALLFIMASGLTLAFGLMRVVNLAHGAFFMLGGYVGVAVLDWTGSLLAGLAAGAGAGLMAGVAMERLLLARVRGLELSEALLTIAIGMMIADALLAGFGGHPKSLAVPRRYVAASISGSSPILGSALASWRGLSRSGPGSGSSLPRPVSAPPSGPASTTARRRNRRASTWERCSGSCSLWPACSPARQGWWARATWRWRRTRAFAS